MSATKLPHSAALPAARARHAARRQRLATLAATVAAAAFASLLGGCAVVTVAGTAASLVVGTVGLAADATIGAARVTGKAIGAAAGAVTPSSGEK